MNRNPAKLLFIVLFSGLFVLTASRSFGQVVEKVDADTLNRAVAIDTIAFPRPADSIAARRKVDTTTEDTANAVAVKKGPWQPNPKKAGLYSAILPGLGQAYVGQYWKIPIIYVGVAAAAYFISNNLTKYISYRKAYINRINNPNYVDEYTPIYGVGAIDQLRQLQSDYNKYLDLAVLFTGVGFGLQIVDAITSAHLRNFDISRDISMRVRPVASPQYIGAGLVMNFK